MSIVVPLYNKARYIESCLASLKAQSLHDIEVIVIDDGSIDGGGEIASAFCTDDERFEYIKQENAGVSEALNQGLARVRGEYIAIVAADDWVEEDMYELLYRAATSALCDAPDPADAVTSAFVAHVRCGYVRERAGGRSEAIALTGEPQMLSGLRCFEKLFGEICVPLMSTCFGIYHRQTLLDAGISYPQELSNLEDVYFNARFFALDLDVVLIPECLYHYREDPSSLSQKPSSKLPEQLGIFEGLMQKQVLSMSPAGCQLEKYRENLRSAYAHYRTIAVLTTAADISVFGVEGMRALKESAMYQALCDGANRSGYPKSLRMLIRLLEAERYSTATTYTRLLRVARSIRRAVR